MIVLYSELKKLVPELSAGPQEAADRLTFAGFMTERVDKIIFDQKEDFAFSFEVRQNRPDCLSVLGLARELAACFGISFSYTSPLLSVPELKPLIINIEAEDKVRRVLALKINSVKNDKPPSWLNEYLEVHSMNSVDLLVDISNYVMLYTGYPSHLIDADLIHGNLRWAANTDFNQITTLDGSKVDLPCNGELLIRDAGAPIALAGLVGCSTAAISLYTSSVIIEMAVYDPVVIREDFRKLRIITEASRRLDKELSVEGAKDAFRLLISMIIQLAGGEIATSVFDWHPCGSVVKSIQFDPALISEIAGITINDNDSKQILNLLGFKVDISDSAWNVTVPPFRTDIAQPEDLVEEVIRIYGYQRIPDNEDPRFPIVQDITPANIILTEKIRDILTAQGFDEILSWPLTKNGENEHVSYNHKEWEAIKIQNSVNELYHYMRQSIVSGLLNQMDVYYRKGISIISIFEIGKVFGKKNGEYCESENCAMLSTSGNSTLTDFKNNFESLLISLGLQDLSFTSAGSIPAISNPYACWDISASSRHLGIFYITRSIETIGPAYAAEFDIDMIIELLKETSCSQPVVELEQKLVELDANVELGIKDDIYYSLQVYRQKIDPKKLWAMNIVDAFPLDGRIRYTVRTTYQKMSDQEAKSLHLKVFKLE